MKNILRIFVILLGIAAIVLGTIELDRVSRGLSDKSARNMAITGLILGGVSIILIIVIPIIWNAVGINRFNFGMMGKRSLPELGKFRNFR